MRIVDEVHLGDIYTGKLPVNPTVLALAERIRKGLAVGPIKVSPVVGRRGKFSLLEGGVIYQAYKLLGIKTIKVRYSPKLNRQVH